MSGAWHRGIAAVRVEVPCEGDRHVILWRRGALVLVSHSGADLAMAALGGRRPACLDVLRSWRRAHVEASVHDPLPHAAGLVTGLSTLGRWLTGASRDPVPALPPALRRLRELSMVRTWERGARTLPEAERRVAQERIEVGATAARVREVVEPGVAAVARSMRLPRAFVDVDVGEPAAHGRVLEAGVEVVVRVPPTWLEDVWLRGLAATADGSLVVTRPSRGEAIVAGWVDAPGGPVFALRRVRSAVHGEPRLADVGVEPLHERLRGP